MMKLFAALLGAAAVFAQQSFVAAPFTSDGSFTKEIEGAACDREGNVYAVSFARKATIGRVTPVGNAAVFLDMPPGSLGNGIRFHRDGMAFVADYTGHNILRMDTGARTIHVFVTLPTIDQPNDLAISSDGTLWASDPNWDKGTGQVWRIGADKKVTLAASGMGTTNGIDVSPDGKTLYVNETVQRNVWSFHIEPGGSLTGKSKLIQFPDFGLDGMRSDVDGNLYITRPGKGTVVAVSPAGRILKEVNVLGSKPTNLAFGGPDGRTCYVTEAEHGRLVQFRTNRPGLEWQRRR